MKLSSLRKKKSSKMFQVKAISKGVRKMIVPSKDVRELSCFF